MIYYFKIACLLLLVTQINACVRNHSSRAIVPSKECIALNNRGVNYLMKFPSDESDVDEAIKLFKQALICDPTYVIGYGNLATAYDRKHSYSEEIIALNKELTLTANATIILLEKGIILERINNIDSAKKYYSWANTGYSKELIEHPNDIEIIKQLILIKALMDGKDEAIKMVNEQINLHPDLKEKLSGENTFFKYFDRHAFILGLPSER